MYQLNKHYQQPLGRDLPRGCFLVFKKAGVKFLKNFFQTSKNLKNFS
ncbi:hypothetical protein [Enterococcus phage vB_EfKS5]|nr:hypothetical protein [Enterococcus phage vB_EfKS5]